MGINAEYMGTVHSSTVVIVSWWFNQYKPIKTNNGLLLGQPRQVRRQVHVRH